MVAIDFSGQKTMYRYKNGGFTSSSSWETPNSWISDYYSNAKTSDALNINKFPPNDPIFCMRPYFMVHHKNTKAIHDQKKLGQKKHPNQDVALLSKGKGLISSMTAYQACPGHW